jgi:Uma2 family endonuclease
MTTKQRATIEDLYKIPGKAEIVNGEIISMSPTGGAPGYAGDEIFAALREYSKRTKTGRAIGDNKGFRVDLPNRESFSPDAAYYIGASPGMKFYQGAPIFAAEVRSENDYGEAAEKEIKKKIADYFKAGTKVVWDIDLLGEDVIKAYRFDDPENPIIYKRDDIAEAEPALPGWQFSVNNLFE